MAGDMTAEQEDKRERGQKGQQEGLAAAYNAQLFFFYFSRDKKSTRKQRPSQSQQKVVK